MRRDAYSPYSFSILVLTLCVAVFLLVPVIFIVFYSFNASSYFTLPPEGFSFRWYVAFFANDRFRQALWTSLSMASIVVPVSLVIAIPTSYILVRGQFYGRELLNALVLSPLVIPGVVTGIAFLSFLTATGMGPGFFGLVIAMLCFSLPFSVRALMANLHVVRPELEEAARNLGARERDVFWHVVLPQLRPGLLAGGTFVFVEAIDNFSISAFLVGPNSNTLPVEAYGYIRDFDDPTVAAMAAVLILVSTALVLLTGRLVGLGRMFRVE
jgi:putative spermidine/putrescine transport system permease protein